MEAVKHELLRLEKEIKSLPTDGKIRELQIDNTTISIQCLPNHIARILANIRRLKRQTIEKRTPKIGHKTLGTTAFAGLKYFVPYRKKRYSKIPVATIKKRLNYNHIESGFPYAVVEDIWYFYVLPDCIIKFESMDIDITLAPAKVYSIIKDFFFFQSKKYFKAETVGVFFHDEAKGFNAKEYQFYYGPFVLLKNRSNHMVAIQRLYLDIVLSFWPKAKPYLKDIPYWTQDGVAEPVFMKDKNAGTVAAIIPMTYNTFDPVKDILPKIIRRTKLKRRNI